VVVEGVRVPEDESPAASGSKTDGLVSAETAVGSTVAVETTEPSDEVALLSMLPLTERALLLRRLSMTIEEALRVSEL
jgi:hypothetical protein